MIIKYVEFTSEEAAILIPIVNAVITLHENVFERTIEYLDVKKLAFLEEMVEMLQDGIDLNLDVVIEVTEYYYYELQLLKDILIDMSALFEPVVRESYISIAVKFDKVIQYYSQCKGVNKLCK